MPEQTTCGISFQDRDQALRLCSGSTDSKTLDYQRIPNLRECQIVRIPTKATTCIQDQHHPITSSTLCKMPHPKNKQDKIQTQSSADRITTSLSPAHQRGRKKKAYLLPPECKHKSHPTWSLHKPLDQTYEGRDQKRERIQPWKLGKGDLEHNKFKKTNEKAEKCFTHERTN